MYVSWESGTYGRLSIPWQDAEICSRWAARSVMMFATDCLPWFKGRLDRDTRRGLD